MSWLTRCVGLFSLCVLFAAPVHPGCPGGGSPPRPRPGPDLSGSSTAWEPWWAAHRELYFTIERKPFKKDEDVKKGSASRYKDLPRAKAIEALEKALKDKQRAVRLQAAVALGKIAGEAQREQLERLVDRDKDREVRLTTAMALGLLGRKKSGAKLAWLLNNYKSHDIHRTYAAVGLGMIGDPTDSELLTKVLQRHDSRSIHMSVLIGMGQLRDPNVVKMGSRILLKVKQHKLLRVTAAYAIGMQGTEKALKVLSQAVELRKDDKIVRRALALALGNKLPGKLPATLLRRMITKDKDQYTRAFALLSLARYQNPKSTSLLIEGVKKSPLALRGFVAMALGLQGDKKAIPTLREFLKKYKRNNSHRAAALLALGMLKDTATIRELAEGLGKEKDLGVLGYAVTAIGLSGDKSLVSQVEDVFKARQNDTGLSQACTITLLKLGSKLPYTLLPKTLTTGKKLGKRAAVLALGETANPEMVDALCKALAGESDRRARAGAAFSLGHLFDRSLKYGSLRKLGFHYLFQITPLDRSMRHIFSIEGNGVF